MTDRPIAISRRGLGLATAALAVSARRPAWAQAASGEPVPIGLCASLTSQFAQNGKWMREGVELAVKQVNAAGGIKGRPLKLFVEDDQGVNPTGAVNAVTKLVTQNNVVAVIGPHYTPNILAVAPVLARYAVPGLSGATGPVVTQGGNKFVFRVRLNDTVGAKLLVQFLTGDRNWNKIAVAYVNTAFGQGGFAAVKAELDAENKPPVAVQTHLDNTKDFTPQLLAMKNAGAESVIIWTDDQPMGLMLKQIKTLGLGFGVAGNAGLTLPNVLQLAGDAANGAYSISEFIATNPASQDWAQTYKAAYGAAPELYGSVYYDAAKLVAHALSQTGDASGAAVQAALAQTKDVRGVVTNYTAASNGDMVHSALITRNENDAPVIVKEVREQE